jgi:uroporphyrinogen decarboxylase
MANMTPRERVQLSLSHKQPDKVPWHFGCTTPTRLTLEKYYNTTDLDTVLDQHLAIYRSRLPYVEVRPGFVRDEFGVIWNRTIDKDIGIVDDYLLKERSLKGVTFPDPHDPHRFAPLASFVEKNRNRFRLFMLGHAMFERAWSLRGMEDVMVEMIQAPAFVEELMDAIMEYELEMLDEAFTYDIDGVFFGDDWGQQTGLMFGIRHWRHFIKPRIAKLYSLVKKHNKAVFIHSCGKVQELFPELIELGLDVFNPFQPEVMDPYEIKKQYGSQLSFYGGVSIQRLLPFGTPQQIRDEVKHLMDEVGHEGGFIISPSHDMPGDIPLPNLLAFIDTVLSQR